MFKYVLMAKGALLTGKPLYQNQIDEFLKELNEILV